MKIDEEILLLVLPMILKFWGKSTIIMVKLISTSIDGGNRFQQYKRQPDT